MNAQNPPANRAIVVWLFVLAALVFSMVVLGGVTRLTRSGLSIVEWNPIMGAIPPIGEQQWLGEFAKYQQSPEFQKVNTDMTLTGFKEIFYVEWAHRLLGRLIGFAVLIPLIFFVVTKKLARELVPKIVILLLLGGLQGALGWFMVASGLVDIPRVSPYRLTAHLLTAVLIYVYILWLALSLVRPAPKVDAQASPALRRLGMAIATLVCLMITAGGFVAGTKAGFVFNTFPLMSGSILPPGMYAMRPWWTNLFENVATVQFNHRLLAYVLFVAGLYYLWMSRKESLPNDARRAFVYFFLALCCQILLGISALLLIVPVWLGALHQAGALVVLSLALYLNHAMRKAA